MKKYWSYIKNGLFSVTVWFFFFIMCVVVEEWLETNTMVPAIFALAVFLISLYTDGYLYGILASLLSVLVLNYAFTFPFLKFNFSIPENFISAVIMLVITIMSSALATKIKNQEKIKAETYKETMRANLLRAVSHDLRTPLTTIYGCSSAIEEKLEGLSKEQLLQLIRGIKEDSQWLIGMVENLLSVTRIDTDGVKIVKTPIVLEELIDIVLMRFKKRYPGQKIFVDIPEDFISIPMDAVLIEQVIVNILENAVQHATGMTRLDFRVFTRGKQAVFEIADDGCGIEKERMDNIFTGYFEMKEEPVDNQKRSMGIGLSVCATIIRAHGSSISVENRKEGGCIFRFALDMEEEDCE